MALQHWTSPAPPRPTDLPQDQAKAELRPGPTTPDFRAAFASPLLCGTDRGFGQSQPLAKCVPTRVSLCVLGTSPDPVCSQAASGPAIQASVSPRQKQTPSVLFPPHTDWTHCLPRPQPGHRPSSPAGDQQPGWVSLGPSNPLGEPPTGSECSAGSMRKPWEPEVYPRSPAWASS